MYGINAFAIVEIIKESNNIKFIGHTIKKDLYMKVQDLIVVYYIRRNVTTKPILEKKT